MANLQDKLVLGDDLQQYSVKSKAWLRPFNFKTSAQKSYLQITTEISSSSAPSFLISAKSLTSDGFVNFAGSCVSGTMVAHNLGTSNITKVYMTSDSGKLVIILEDYNNYFQLGHVEIFTLIESISETLPVHNQVSSVALVDYSSSWDLLMDDIPGVKYSSDTVSFSIVDASGQSSSYPDTTVWNSILNAGKFATAKLFTIKDADSNIQLTENFSSDFSTGTQVNPIQLPLDLKTIFSEEDSDYISDESLENILTINVNRLGVVVGVSKDAVLATNTTVGGIKLGYTGDSGLPILLDSNDKAYVKVDDAYIRKYANMPSAASHQNEIVEYIGDNNPYYVNGWFYKSALYPMISFTWYDLSGIYQFVNSSLDTANTFYIVNLKRNNLLNPNVWWKISAEDQTGTLSADSNLSDLVFTISDTSEYNFKFSYAESTQWGLKLNLDPAATKIGVYYDQLLKYFKLVLSNQWAWIQYNVLPIAEWNNLDIGLITKDLIIHVLNPPTSIDLTVPSEYALNEDITISAVVRPYPDDPSDLYTPDRALLKVRWYGKDSEDNVIYPTSYTNTTATFKFTTAGTYTITAKAYYNINILASVNLVLSAPSNEPE